MSYIEDLFNLNGRVALVTGAARGNGKGIAEALLKAGATVYLVDILPEELDATVVEFCAHGLNAHGLCSDLTEPGACDALVSQVLAKQDRIDILVNNAGITRSNPVFDYTEKDWDETLGLNLKVPFLLSQKVACSMRDRQIKGSIINITSLNAELAFPDNPAYVSAKGGLKMLTRSLARDLGCHGIRANSVGPGYFKTQMTKGSWNNTEMRQARSERTILSRWGFPEQDLAGIIIFLASEASSYVTGQEFYIDGGWLANGLS